MDTPLATNQLAKNSDKISIRITYLWELFEGAKVATDRNLFSQQHERLFDVEMTNSCYVNIHHVNI